MFASRTVAAHMMRGVIAAALLTWAAVHQSSDPAFAVGAAVAAVAAMRGCPLCWTLGLVDPDGGLFRNFDPATFDATQVDIGQSFFNFSDDIRSYRATVAFDSLTIDGHSQQVPEPATLSLLGIGLLLLPLIRRRTR